MAETEGVESTDSEINVDFLHPRFQSISLDPDIALDDATAGRGITSEDSSKSSITPRSSARLPLGDERKLGRSKLWSFSGNESDSLELRIPPYHENYRELHRARSTRNLELWVDPQVAPPPRIVVVDPAYERKSLRKQLSPDAIASMPCLPRFASGEGLEYVYGDSDDETGTPKLAGEGQYGCVYLARHDRTGQLLTIKLLSSEASTIYDLALEASINQHLEVTTVVPNFWGIGVVERDSRYLRYCLVQEYVGNARTLEGYDVNRFLTINKLSRYFHGCVPPFDSVDWTGVCCRIVTAMGTIHRMGIVINDLKGDNILIRFDGATTNHLYFVDFGMARYRTNLLVDFGLETYEERDNFIERFFIMAPEIVYTRQCYEASDIFSLGWLLAGVSARCNLPQLKGVAEWCLKPLPSQRPTAQQLLQTTKDVFYDAIRRKMALCTHQYLLSRLWRLYALSPDNFYLLVSR